MLLRRILVFLTLGLIIVLVIGGCVKIQAPRTSPDITVTQARFQITTHTYTQIPTLTTTPTLTPTITFTPTISPTPTVVLPVREGTPFPQGVSSISAENAKEVVELSRWGEGVPQDMAWTPDGKWLVIATTQGIHAFSVDTWEPLQYSLGKNDNFVSLAMCNHYVAGGVRYEGTIKIWDLQTGRLIRSFNSPFWVPHLACSLQGIVAAASGEDVLLWDVNTGRQINNFKIPAKRYGITALAFSSDGSMLATGSLWEHEVNILDTRTGELITKFEAAPEELTFSPDGEIIAIADLWDQEVKLFDVSTGSLLQSFQHHHKVQSVSFDATGKFIASASMDHTVKIWPIEGGDAIFQFALFRHGEVWPERVRFASNGMLATAFNDGVIRVWQHNRLVTTLNFSPPFTRAVVSNQGILVAGSSDRAVAWDIFSGQRLLEVTGDKGVALSPDGNVIASASLDDEITLWNVPVKTPLPYVLSGPEIDNLEGVWVTPKKVFLFLWHHIQRSIYVWKKGNNGFLLQKQPVGQGVMKQMSPDGKFLVGLGSAGDIVFYSPVTMYVSKTLNWSEKKMGIVDFTFSPDGEIFAALSWKRKERPSFVTLVRLWDFESFQPIRTMRIEMKEEYGTAIAFSSGKDLLFIGISKGNIYLWDLATNTAVTTLHGHRGNIRFLHLLPQNRALLSVSDDGTVRVWGIQTGGETPTVSTPTLSQCPAEIKNSPSHMSVVGDYEQNAQYVLLYTNGEVNTRIKVPSGGFYIVFFSARGFQADGVFSKVELRVNGEISKTWPLTQDWQTYQALVAVKAKVAAVSIVFVNDKWKPDKGEDRSVWVKTIGIWCP